MNVNRNIAIGLIALWGILFASYAFSQDFVVVPPPAGLPPILQWILGVASSLMAVFVPLAVLLLKQHLGVQNDVARAGMINGAISRAAFVADIDMTKQNLTIGDIGKGTATMNSAIGYVHDSHPDAIAATPQADDTHLSQAILAEVQRIQLSKADSAIPTVVLSPVSTIR